ncbi:phytanoyl-CoA dioxygenase family protein [Novosphingobium sp. Leaf2]|uniref:phytanoyl-CoA dioxygenase family protein n=1 Tax=Novosphingobium sp. Leaf2 TaxID=1735670 RepID=UPI0006FBBD96|nr:phytanoyl-CoA dioxygenase family protein [Novosphingobium sp. Leaf2]KQM19614.1 hypothetical protein ASE49_05195 [Novosphingobium sp. Leaf2]
MADQAPAVPATDRIAIESWNDKEISGTVRNGDAVRLNIYLANRRMVSLDASVPLVHFDNATFQVNTEFFPAACLRDINLTIEHADGAISSFNPNDVRHVSNAVPHSLYGGMWIDYPDWEERLNEKLRDGVVSETVAELIRTFVADGYVVIPQAVSPEVVAHVNDRMLDVWAGQVPGHKIEVYGESVQVVDVDSKYYSQAHKLLDSYAFIPEAQHAASAPAVVEFMSAVFEDKPKAFQQLTFEWGSQQAIHKDTAYVKIDGNPMSMMATWVALEDITEGTGELEYYVGSHRSPDYIFGSLSKWMEAAPQEHEDFLAALHADAEAYGHRRAKFLPKAGDVLIWHADLAHGGSAVTRHGVTRRSQVTHFTAAKNAPYYSRWSGFASNVRNGVEFVSSYSNVTPD